jgi:4-amino-4-deoxy-L-arabinose transferase-like glycosyltransferase
VLSKLLATAGLGAFKKASETSRVCNTSISHQEEPVPGKLDTPNVSRTTRRDETTPAWRPWQARFFLGLVGLVPLLVSWYTLHNQSIEGLDQAHHIMDGMFFRDLIVDHPFSHLKDYGLNYYTQYPALGFKFWPPFFPLIEGLFLLVFGMHIVVARWCLLAFGMLLAVLVFLGTRDILGSWVAALTTMGVVTTSLIVEHLNTVMLEVPTLAMALLTIYLYQRMVQRGHWQSWLEALGFACIGAMAVYTKQTIIFIFPALFIDVLVNHRHLLRSRSTWVATTLIVLLCIPLLVFTVQFSLENLVQSFGNQGDVYVKAHKVAPRWSIDGWTYYIWQVSDQCQFILAGLALAALGYCLISRQFARHNTLWAAWTICWYLLFSYFDNKQPRFVTFVIPGVTILGCSFAWVLLKGGYWKQRIVFAGLATIIVLQVLSGFRSALPPGISGMDEIIHELFRVEKANIAFLGDYRQLFIPFVRIHDPERSVYTLRLERLLSSEMPVKASDIAHRYRIKWFLIEPASADALHLPSDRQRELTTEPFELVGTREFGTHSKRIKLDIYRYRGSWAERMAPISYTGLNNSL